MGTIRIFCMSRATSLVTHMAGSEGNEAVIARRDVSCNGVVRRIPYVSGNSMRSCCVRQPGMRWLIDRYGLAGKLTLPELNFLLHGGALTESTGREDVARIVEMHATWPLLKALGGCLPDQIIKGRMLGCDAHLVCEENRNTLAALLPDGFELPDTPLLPAETYVRPYQYVTFDAADREPELLPPKIGDSEAKPRGSDDVRMMYTGQAVSAGAIFIHDFLIQWAKPEDAGAVLWSLNLWQSAGGVVGGMGAKGHGRLATSVHITGTGATVQQLIDAYLAVADEMKDRALAWLAKAFATKEQKPKGRKAKVKEPVIPGTEE